MKKIIIFSVFLIATLCLIFNNVSAQSSSGQKSQLCFSSVSPLSGSPGATVTVNGTGFQTHSGGIEVYFADRSLGGTYRANVQPNIISNSQFNFRVPTNAPVGKNLSLSVSDATTFNAFGNASNSIHTVFSTVAGGSSSTTTSPNFQEVYVQHNFNKTWKVFFSPSARQWYTQKIDDRSGRVDWTHQPVSALYMLGDGNNCGLIDAESKRTGCIGNSVYNAMLAIQKDKPLPESDQKIAVNVWGYRGRIANYHIVYMPSSKTWASVKIQNNSVTWTHPDISLRELVDECRFISSDDHSGTLTSHIGFRWPNGGGYAAGQYLGFGSAIVTDTAAMYLIVGPAILIPQFFTWDNKSVEEIQANGCGWQSFLAAYNIPASAATPTPVNPAAPTPASPQSGTPAPSNPTTLLTVNLTASPSRITTGESTTLRWAISRDLVSCTRSWSSTNVTSSGSQSISPTRTTAYSMTCRNSIGVTRTANTTVTVGAASSQAGRVNLKINNSEGAVTLSSLQNVTISWIGERVGSCEIISNDGKLNGVSVESAGDMSFAPTDPSYPRGSVTYSILCRQLNSSGGLTSILVTDSNTVTTASSSNSNPNNPTPTPSPTPTPTPTPSPSPSPTPSTPNTNTTTLGTPVINFTPTLFSITVGQSPTLSWSTTNATTCTGSSNMGIGIGTSGIKTVTPSQTTTYTLTCRNGTSGPQASKSVTITVNTQSTVNQPAPAPSTPAPTPTTQPSQPSAPVLPPAPTGLVATPGACGTGRVTLSWSSVAGASAYRVYRNGSIINTVFSNSYEDSGLTAGSSINYYVTAWDGIDSNSSISVNTTAPSSCSSTGQTNTTSTAPTVNWFYVTPSGPIPVGTSITFNWSTRNTTSCTINNLGNVSSTGSQTVEANFNGAYILSCINSSGQSVSSQVNVSTYSNDGGGGSGDDTNNGPVIFNGNNHNLANVFSIFRDLVNLFR